MYINNVLKLADFDLVREGYGPGFGFWRELTNITGSNGAITVKIVPKQTWSPTWEEYVYQATISGIKVTAQ